MGSSVTSEATPKPWSNLGKHSNTKRKSLTTILDETAWRRAIAGGDWGIICNLASLVSYVSLRTTEDFGDPFEIAPFTLMTLVRDGEQS
ncbi:hypothetical protein BDV25DRAFT_141429 [Aspergillus avenaceus]|uniref:Uncharacterized protein n=1 Tax=Aspergillus avenaceus TaxID=36643 RepID=A0A5N6TQZ9_ASPAV|nr:hypothetical protein BDV25DRAFT_141429 [Aspergillus avenaceus]